MYCGNDTMTSQGYTNQNGVVSHNTNTIPGTITLPKEAYMAYVRGEITAALEDQKHHNKMEEISAKAALASVLEDEREKRREKRENASIAPFQDADGYLRIQKSVTHQKAVISEPIFKWPWISLQKVISPAQKRCVAHLISWNGEHGRVNALLKKMETSEFVKVMDCSGNPFKIGRDRKRQLGDMVYGFLIENSDTLLLPDYLGWNKMEDDNWFFAWEHDSTIQGLMEGSCVF